MGLFACEHHDTIKSSSDLLQAMGALGSHAWTVRIRCQTLPCWRHGFTLEAGGPWIDKPMNIMLRTALLGSVAAATLAGPNFALAQSQPAAKAADAEVGEVVVTGSRIRRPDLTSVQPIQVITTETIEERGFTNVADALTDHLDR